jgi:HSP20 family molecular chaperone IbpA
VTTSSKADGAKGEGAKATFKNGVLEVAVPMAKPASAQAALGRE